MKKQRHKNLLRSFVGVLATTLLSGCVVHIGHHDERFSAIEKFERQLSLPTTGLNRLSVESGAGDIRIIGVTGIDQVLVDGKIRASGSQDYIFELERSDQEVILVGKPRRHGFGFNRNIRVDMTIRVPPHLSIEIEDGSGDIVVSDVDGAVNIHDGSGSIDISHLGSELVIEDGSGDIHLSHVDGKVEIEDGSGDIEIMRVSNLVQIDDGSGDISVTQVERLEIIESGSGEVYTKDVNSHL